MPVFKRKVEVFASAVRLTHEIELEGEIGNVGDWFVTADGQHKIVSDTKFRKTFEAIDRYGQEELES